MYKLSRVIHAHKRDIRCLDYYAGILLTGGNDKRFSLYSYQDGNHALINSSDICEAEIVALRINRLEGNEHLFAVLGCRNGRIYGIDRQGNPCFEIQHDSPISSIDFIDPQHIVTGSWDGKAIVWNLASRAKVSEYNEHKHAVAVFFNLTTNQVVSGSQDKALNLWEWQTGKKVLRVQNAHNDIIREITDVQGCMIITCSNDEKVKLWSADLEPIQTLSGHTAFVFAVKSFKLGHYVSGGQDRTLKIWSQSLSSQDIALPCSIWSIALDPNSDIFVAGSDGFLRTFTTDASRYADQDVEQMFNKQVGESASKRSGMSEADIAKLMTTSQMKAVKGKKEGEIRVFRNGMNPEAFIWQNGAWVKIGDVITEGGPEGMKAEPRYYPGDNFFPAGEYDYVFDVDDESGIPKVIPFNDGDNPLQAAERYCKREGLTKGYIEQIRKFLIQNSKNAPRRKAQQQKKEVNLNGLRCTPSSNLIEYNDIKNPAALFNKVKEFNQRAEGLKLNAKELQHIERIILQLQNSGNYHNWKLDFKEMDALKKILNWPREIKFPVWDMLRAFLKHYQSEALFSGLQAGGEIITSLAIGLESDFSEAIFTLILKTFCNALIQNSNKGGMLKNSQIIFISLKSIGNKTHLTSANFLSTFAAFLYNYSIALIEKKLEREELLSDFAQVLKRRLQLDSNPENRGLLLQAGANILSRYHQQIKGQYEFLLGFLQNDDVSSDIKAFY